MWAERGSLVWHGTWQGVSLQHGTVTVQSKSLGGVREAACTAVESKPPILYEKESPVFSLPIPRLESSMTTGGGLLHDRVVRIVENIVYRGAAKSRSNVGRGHILIRGGGP